MQDCRKRYLKGVEDNIVNDNKTFWKYVNHQRSNQSFPCNMFYNNLKSDNPRDSANLFASYFESVYSNDPGGNISYTSVPSVVSLNWFNISVEQILEKLNALDSSTNPGPDGIASIFLKSCSANIAVPLCTLYMKSLLFSELPSLWKVSYVTPIFKKGNRSDVSNYRPICIGPAIAKIFDSIVADFLSFHLKPLIIDEQHGFFKGRSTTTNLLTFTTYIFSNLESGFDVDCIFTDMTKAFDRVNINILISKFYSIGLRDPLLSWLYSYLFNRQQFVIVNGVKSRSIEVTSGVPQGSHLGPLLFSVYINDVKKVINNSNLLLFADDLKLYNKISNSIDCCLLQPDLDALKAWCVENKLDLNVNKCKAMRFSRKLNPDICQYLLMGQHLETVVHIRDLGVTLDPHLTYNVHIDEVLSKANKMLGFITRLSSEFFNLRVLLILYSASVRSNLEYCTTIWSPYYNCHIKRIEKIQKKFVKNLCYKFNILYDQRNYDTILEYLGLVPLAVRRVMFDACFIFKILSCVINCSVLLDKFLLHVPSYQVRNSHLLYIPFHRTLYGCNSSMCRLAQLTFHLRDIDFVGVSYSCFRSQARSALKM